MSTETQTESHATYTTEEVLPRTFGLFILYVDRWAEAIAFYRDTLEWALLHQEPNAWAEFKTGGVRFALHGMHGDEAAKPSDTHLSFFVADVDASVAALREKGVKITKEPEVVCEGVRCASFADPFGNVLHLTGK